MDLEPNTAVAGGETLSFAQVGRTGPLIGLSFKILLLNLLTLTIYRFWGRTEVRRYLWSTTTINGEPLEYSGTGLELFLGFLYAVFLVILPFGGALYALQIYLLPKDPLLFAIGVLVWYAAFLLLLPFGYFRAWRYRLSRTKWRGVRFSLDGKGYGFALKAAGLYLLSIVTLGLAIPIADARLTNHLLGHTYFGSRAFRSEGKARAVYPAFLITAVLVILTYAGMTGAFALLMPDLFSTPENLQAHFLEFYAILLVGVFLVQIAMSFYMAQRLRVFGGGLSLEGARFSLNATARSYFSLTFTNMLLIIFTLGFALPIAELRVFRYLFSRLEAEGAIDLAAIVQSSADQPQTGEGLAEAFGFGTW